MRLLLLSLVMLLLAAQTPAQTPDAALPSTSLAVSGQPLDAASQISTTPLARVPPAVKPRPQPPELAAYYTSVFAGPIASIGSATRGGYLAGGSFGGLVGHRSLRAFTFPGFDLELAAISPVQPGNIRDGIFSFNLQPGFTNRAQTLAPYLTAGYSRVFASGNALNYGAGINLIPKGMPENGHFLRIEARDYYTFATQRQHLVTLRIAFCFGVPDV